MHRRRRIFATAVAVMLAVVGIDALVYLHANGDGTSFISAAAPSPTDGTRGVTKTTHKKTASKKHARPTDPSSTTTIPPIESAAPPRGAASKCAIPVHLFAFVMQEADPGDTTTTVTEPPPPTTTTTEPPPPTTTTTEPPPPPPPPPPTTTTTHPKPPPTTPPRGTSPHPTPGPGPQSVPPPAPVPPSAFVPPPPPSC